MIINIRGTNGSGKTTLARRFQEAGSPVILTQYEKPIKAGTKTADIAGILATNDIGTVCCVGSYKQAQGGMDTIPSFKLQMEAVRKASTLADHVICEGILASTVAGSWIDFFRMMREEGQRVLVAYLNTPPDVCLQRIRDRQKIAGKEREIKQQLVLDKIRAIAATRQKFAGAGIETVVLPYQRAYETLLEKIDVAN